MKAGATICAIVFALLCSAPAADTAESSGGAIRPASSEAPVSQQHIETVTISPEAQACFDWFSKLGYPDLKDAPWIDVSTQPVNPPASFASQPPFRMVGYLISDTGNEFRFLAPDLEQVTREKSEPEANPQSRSWYEERPFFDMAKARLAELQGPPDADRERRSVYGRVDPMSQVFFLAYVCWQKGDAALAQELFNEAAKMSLVERERNGSKAGTATIQVSLERDFGKAAFIDAAFRFEGSPASLLGRVSVQEPAPRADLLKTFRQFPALYPASPYVKQAEGMAAILEKMVAEDALYKTLPAEELAKLPVEKQVDELIFLLRDQRGVWLFQSFDNIPFLSGEGSPAARLIAIGYPAVPKLIASLGDQRFSRVTREHGSPMGGFGAGTLDLSRPIASVGNCAEAILDDIAGRHFRGRYPETASITPKAIWEDKKLDAVRDAIESWWRDFQANGEKKTLIDALSSGKAPPQPLVQKLKAKFPDSVSDAVIRGAANAEEEWITREFIDELAALKSKPAAEQLRKMTTGNKSESIRIKGAGALLAPPQSPPPFASGGGSPSQEGSRPSTIPMDRSSCSSPAGRPAPCARWSPAGMGVMCSPALRFSRRSRNGCANRQTGTPSRMPNRWRKTPERSPSRCSSTPLVIPSTALEAWIRRPANPREVRESATPLSWRCTGSRRAFIHSLPKPAADSGTWSASMPPTSGAGSTASRKFPCHPPARPNRS